MEISPTTKRVTWRAWLPVVWLFIVFGAALTFDSWKNYVREPWISPTSDLSTLGSLYLKTLDPALFPKDYAFSTDRYLAFYTPSFVNLTARVGSMTGDLPLALLVIQYPLMVLYLCCAALYFWQVTESRVLSVAFALLSLNGVIALSDLWLVDQIVLVLPRTVALPAVLIAASLFFLGLRRSSWLIWLICGLMTGVAMNLHPTTGMVLAIVFGLAACAGFVRLRKPGIPGIIALVIGTVIAALPIIQNISSNSGTLTGAPGDFKTFADVFMQRLFMLPLPEGIPGFHLTLFSQAQQTFMGIFWLPLSLVLWVLMQRFPRSPAAALFGITQLAYTWLLAQTVAPVWIIAMSLYLLWRWRAKKLDAPSVELRLSELAAGIIFVTLFLPLVLRPVWFNFQIRGLSMFLAEFTRGGRLFVLTIYGLSAVTLLNLWQDFALPAWSRFRGSSTYAQIASRLTSPLFALIFAVIAGALAETIMLRALVYVQFYVPPVTGAVAGLALWIARTLRWPTRSAVIFVLLISAVLAVVLHFMGALIFGLTPLFLPIMAALPLIFIAYDEQHVPDRSPLVHGLAYGLVSLLVGAFVISFSARTFVDNRANSATTPPIVQAALWAHDNTPVDSLFYYASGGDPGSSDMSQFRYYAARSVSHSAKDLSMVAYSYGDELARLTTRQEHLEQLSLSPEGLQQAVDELAADYVILDDRVYAPLPAWTEVYRNQVYAIYRVK